MKLNEWIIAIRLTYFNLHRIMRTKGEFSQSLWRTSIKLIRNCNVGDIVFLYVTKPVGAIKYRCIVLEVNIEEEYVLLKAIDYYREGITCSYLEENKFCKHGSHKHWDRVYNLSNTLSRIHTRRYK